jgi:hypothetical protein
MILHVCRLLAGTPTVAWVFEISYFLKAAQGKDTSDLEKEIDDLVYELYGITEEERKVIEGN